MPENSERMARRRLTLLSQDGAGIHEESPEAIPISANGCCGGGHHEANGDAAHDEELLTLGILRNGCAG